MKSFNLKLLSFALLFCIAQVAVADRGIGKKNKNKTILNIITPGTLRNSIPFNLKSGLSFKGSLLINNPVQGNAITTNSLVTFDKGNMTYIIPYKHRIAIPEIQSGYTGMKIIIRPN